MTASWLMKRDVDLLSNFRSVNPVKSDIEFRLMVVILLIRIYINL